MASNQSTGVSREGCARPDCGFGIRVVSHSLTERAEVLRCASDRRSWIYINKYIYIYVYIKRTGSAHVFAHFSLQSSIPPRLVSDAG